MSWRPQSEKAKTFRTTLRQMRVNLKFSTNCGRFWLSGKFMDYPDSFCPGSSWAVWTVSRLSGQFLDIPDCFWLVWTASALSGQFLVCPESFWIIRNFLNCLDSFLIVRIVSKLSGQFLDCPESFWIVWKVSSLNRIDTKGQYFPYCKNFPDFCKNFLDSNAATLTRFFWLWWRLCWIRRNVKWQETSNEMKCQMTDLTCKKCQMKWNVKWNEMSNEMKCQMKWNVKWQEMSNDKKCQMETW